MPKKRARILTPKQKMGKDSKVRGLINENRSMQHILSNYGIYGVPDKSHVYFTPRGNKHTMDLFSTRYFDSAGNLRFAGFDIVAISDGKNRNGIFIGGTLVQVKSTKLPTKQYLKILCDFPVSASVNKELHLWVGDTLHKYPLDGTVDFSKIKL